MNIGGNRFGRGTAIAAIEADSSQIKIAAIEEHGGTRIITRLMEKQLAEKETISGILNKERVYFDELIIVLTRDRVTTRNLELPTVDSQEIRDIINIQAGKQTPFAREEIVADFSVIGTSRQRYAKVLLAIVQKAVVKAVFAALPGRREAVSKVVLGSECLANWYWFLHPKVKDDTFAIIYFDQVFSDFCVLSKGKLIYTKLLDIRAGDIPNEQDWKKKFEGEVRYAIDGFKTDNAGPGFSKVVFMGSNRFSSQSAEVLNDKFMMQVFGPFEASKVIGLTKQADSFLREQEKSGVPFSNLVALAIDPDRPALDFSPLDIKAARRESAKRKQLAKAAALLAAIALVGIMITWEGVYSKSLLIKRMDKQLSRLEAETKEVETKSAVVDIVKKRLDAKNSAVEVLAEIYKGIPQDVYLTAVVYDETGSVSLRGTSSDMSGVFRFVKTLRASPVFKEVKSKYVTKRKELSDFEITCQLSVR